jgi:hypothetical protein
MLTMPIEKLSIEEKPRKKKSPSVNGLITAAF